MTNFSLIPAAHHMNHIASTMNLTVPQAQFIRFKTGGSVVTDTAGKRTAAGLAKKGLIEIEAVAVHRLDFQGWGYTVAKTWRGQTVCNNIEFWVREFVRTINESAPKFDPFLLARDRKIHCYDINGEI